ncbi:MAG: helix-turn-helix transcriptional regulator [Anaerococcus vaginalis]|uniref:helix-turn-helix domain-containing protein n=1 Tax=Bacillota TaxID=1239 RepID=UPI00290D79AE|nr:MULTISPECIES: helix-turn-helix transcriptional regulator [Bacillota]MDU4321093.1 helix-turn-helix transcriptional regulator [Clostridium sp.]MDU4379691.1 helix-turn-helix transcriptional regulator [Anaerococcus vaginalis]
MNIGENLKRIRKVKGLTQDKLSELTKISITSIQRYESGKRQPTVESVNKIAAALEVSVFELLDNKYDKAEYELINGLSNGCDNLLNLVSSFEDSAKEESIKNFRNLIKLLDLKKFENIDDNTIYNVINSHEFYDYLEFLFFKELNKKK